MKFVLILGGLAATAAVAGVCLIGLIVWLAGGKADRASEAWRKADES